MSCLLAYGLTLYSRWEQCRVQRAAKSALPLHKPRQVSSLAYHLLDKHFSHASIRDHIIIAQRQIPVYVCRSQEVAIV